MVDKEFESRDDEYQINFSSSRGELARFLSLFMHSSRRILSLARATLNQERESIRGDRTYRGLCDFEGNDGTGARMSAIVFVERILLVLR